MHSMFIPALDCAHSSHRSPIQGRASTVNEAYRPTCQTGRGHHKTCAWKDESGKMAKSEARRKNASTAKSLTESLSCRLKHKDPEDGNARTPCSSRSIPSRPPSEAWGNGVVYIYVILYHVLCCIILHYVILYYIISYQIKLYYTIFYYIVLYSVFMSVSLYVYYMGTIAGLSGRLESETVCSFFGSPMVRPPALLQALGQALQGQVFRNSTDIKAGHTSALSLSGVGGDSNHTYKFPQVFLKATASRLSGMPQRRAS